MRIADFFRSAFFIAIQHKWWYKSIMRVKTSITLSEDILQDLERVTEKGRNRSAIIEGALHDYISKRAKKLRDTADLQILNKNFKRLNREASDVLTYQIDQSINS